MMTHLLNYDKTIILDCKVLRFKLRCKRDYHSTVHCVCVYERERVSFDSSVRVREERGSIIRQFSVCVCERESIIHCVCMREREKVSFDSSVCVREREYHLTVKCVCERGRVSFDSSVSECVIYVL